MALNSVKLNKKPPSERRSEWEKRAWKILRTQMRGKKIPYAELSYRLKVVGINERPDQINRKVNRKKFSAGFFLACLSMMEVESLPIGKGTTYPAN